MALVGIGEMARILERDPKALRNAVRNGRISQRADGMFDTETVLAEWEANTNHLHGHNNRTKKVVEIDQQAADPASEEPPADLPLNGERPAQGTDFAKARAATQIYTARLRKLEYEEKAKSLTPARDVADATFQSYRVLRDACMNIPSRLAGVLSTEGDVERCYQILENEVITIFQDFSEGKIA
jgi:hypothetical protein